MLVMSIADKWYASATFWTATGVVVALLAVVATVLVTYMVSFPKRRLLYGMPVVAPLLRAPADARQDLELLYRGEALAAPHVLEIELISRGRKDTPSSAYDSAKPMRLDVGARIVGVLRTTSHPESLSVPKVIVDGQSLMIGPSLIGKRQQSPSPSWWTGLGPL